MNQKNSMMAIILLIFSTCLVGQLILNFCTRKRVIKHSILFLIIMTAAIAVLLAFGFWGEDGFFRGELIADSFLMIADCFALIGIGIAHLVYYIVKNKK